MYKAKFNIEYRPYAVELFSFLNDLGFEVNRDGNIVTVSDYNEKAIYKALNQGNDFLDQKEAVYESWDDWGDDCEDEIINPFNEFGVFEKSFY